ncbi:lysophospholipid acyltransferase family protein [Arsukibacterium sp.]|uniref:lysophospholipid acyltransferase family protein n=1 Tax=Arsukibacterium sp. TaxID=1977258 RepID=UPI002FD99B14
MMSRIARWLLRRFGWRCQGQLPACSHCVIIFAPHTSNWDFVLMYLYKLAMGVRVSFLGKHQIFRWPFGWFFRALGGIPVIRDQQQDVVELCSRLFAEQPRLWLAMAPEGTRSKTAYWRTGFYYIALKAGIPVQLTYLDNNTKTLGLGPCLQLTGDIQQDFAQLRQFYADKEGIRPALASTITPRPK